MLNRRSKCRKLLPLLLLAAAFSLEAGGAVATPNAFEASESMLPRLTARDVDGSSPVTLEELSVSVLVRGHIARTSFELTYRNHDSRDLNGEFVVPLPEGAEVTDLGLYFDDVLRHAVSVKREKARAAFEEVVHRRVDPILAEWSEGNAFRYEVYPIPARGTKKIFVAWDQDLRGGPLSGFALRLTHASTLARAELRVDSDPGSDAIVESAAGRLRIGHQGRTTIEDSSLDVLVRVLPAEPRAGVLERIDGTSWVSILVRDELPREPVPPSSHVVVFWDASGSAAASDRDALIHFLEAFVRRQRPDVRLTVVPFHFSIDSPINVRVPTLGGETIRRTIESIPAIGATDLSALAEGIQEMISPLPDDGRVLIVTDGLQTLGKRLSADRLRDKLSSLRWPVTVVTAAKQVNRPLLDAISGATGGWSLSVQPESIDESVAEAMVFPASVEILGSPQLTDLTPTGRIVVSGDQLVVRGRSAQRIGGACSIRLRVHSRDGYVDRVVNATVGEIEDGGGIVRTSWARSRIRDLISMSGTNEEMVELGVRHGLLTPETSLIVLEDWRDYLRYGIPMPEDVKAAHARWEEQRKSPPATPVNVSGLSPSPPVVAGSWLLRAIVWHEGAPLPGATVKLRIGSTGYFAVSDVNGMAAFSLPATPEGALTISAELEGMDTTTRLIPAATPSGSIVELTLSLATVSEAITVTAAAPTHLQSGGSAGPGSQRSGVQLRAEPACPECESILDEIIARDVSDEDRDVLFWAHRTELVDGISRLIRGETSDRAAAEIYLRARTRFGGSKLFHMRAAEAMRSRNHELGLRVLSDLVETFADDPPFLRLVSQIFISWGREDLARATLERALDLAPQQPQGWRDLILLEARSGNESRVEELAARLASRPRDQRFPEVYDILQAELSRYRQASSRARNRGIEIESVTAKGLTGVMRWDSNYSYVDLHVCEPTSNVVNYSDDEGLSGGRLLGGYTEGFGPQIYMNPGPAEGRYRFFCEYYSSDETEVNTESIAVLTIYAPNRLGRIERSDYPVVVSGAREQVDITSVVVR